MAVKKTKKYLTNLFKYGIFSNRKSCAKGVPMSGLVKSIKAVRADRPQGLKLRIKRQERLTICSASQEPKIRVNPEVCKYPFSFHCFFFKTVK